MGVSQYVSADRFPKQGAALGVRVDVCFNYDTTRIFPGVIVRDDVSEPFLTIIGLDDGRYLLATECQLAIKT